MIAITTSSFYQREPADGHRRGAERFEWRGLFSHLADSLDFVNDIFHFNLAFCRAIGSVVSSVS